jgi:hypothetical protein
MVLHARAPRPPALLLVVRIIVQCDVRKRLGVASRLKRGCGRWGGGGGVMKVGWVGGWWWWWWERGGVLEVEWRGGVGGGWRRVEGARRCARNHRDVCVLTLHEGGRYGPRSSACPIGRAAEKCIDLVEVDVARGL